MRRPHRRSAAGLGVSPGRADWARKAASFTLFAPPPARASAGDGQVIGDPGLGKSRLVSEFVQDLRQRGIEVHEAHCQAHAHALLVPVLEMLRSYFGITEDLGPEVARARLEARVLEVDARLAGELPLIFEFLAVPVPDRWAQSTPRRAGGGCWP